MQYITLSEAKAKFSEVVEKVMAGEAITITKMGKPAVELKPAVKNQKASLFGCMKGQIIVHGDFNEWPEEEARALGIID